MLLLSIKASLAGLVLSASLANALPRPDLDLDALNAMPAPAEIDPDVAFTSVDVSSAASAALATALPSVTAYLADAASSAAASGGLRRRTSTVAPSTSTAAPRPAGNYLPDTAYTGASDASSFQSYQPWISNAASASLSGWTQVYTGQKSTRGNIPGVLQINTLSSYDPSACAAKCQGSKLCQGFAMWYERTPSVAPTSTNQDPDPAYWVKCLSYAYPLNAADATNSGQYSQKFYRTQTGASFFNKNVYSPPTVPGYDAPVTLTHPSKNLPAAIVVSKDDYNNNIDPLVSTPGPMSSLPDPTVCKKLCDTFTADKAFYNGVQKACNFFNIFELAKNGQSIGFQCQYYTDPFGSDHAKNTGQFQDKDVITVVGSWGYTANPLTTPSAQLD